MAFSPAPSTSDSTIFIWDTTRQGIDSHFFAKSGAFALATVNAWTGQVLKNGAGLQNDEVNLGNFVIEEEGTFTFYVNCEKNTANGIMTIYLNGTSKGTIDTYAAASSFNEEETLNLGTLTEGVYSLSIKMATKNGAATAYVGVISSAAVYKS